MVGFGIYYWVYTINRIGIQLSGFWNLDIHFCSTALLSPVVCKMGILALMEGSVYQRGEGARILEN